VNNPPATTDDAQLLRRIGQQDGQALSQLYDRYAGVLYSAILRVLHDPNEAADVLRNVFLQIWNRADRYDPVLGKPFHWALALTRHQAVDRLHSLKRRYRFIEEITHEMETEHLALATNPDQGFTREQVALIRSAVAELPLEQRQAIEMAFLGGLTQNEIAAALNQPLGTIKARTRRGMLKLRDGLRAII
jgi:RNA polymerase sigma-70 factor (ECF subfamily)